MSPLTNDQKRTLACLARDAYRAALADSDGALVEDEATWRHNQTIAAVNKHGLRCCDQGDYAALMGHFLHLIGREDAALYWHLRAQSEPRRQAEVVLRRELAKRNLQVNYAETICINMFKCALVSASAAQLWKLSFTIRNRRPVSTH